MPSSLIRTNSTSALASDAEAGLWPNCPGRRDSPASTPDPAVAPGFPGEDAALTAYGWLRSAGATAHPGGACHSVSSQGTVSTALMGAPLGPDKVGLGQLDPSWSDRGRALGHSMVFSLGIGPKMRPTLEETDKQTRGDSLCVFTRAQRQRLPRSRALWRKRKAPGRCFPGVTCTTIHSLTRTSPSAYIINK